MSAFYVWPLTYKQKLPLYFFSCNCLWPPHLSLIFLVFFLFLPLCFRLVSIFWSILFLSIHFSAFFPSPLFFLVPLAVIWICNIFLHILIYTYISIYYFLYIIREEFFPIPKDSFHIQTVLLAKKKKHLTSSPPYSFLPTKEEWLWLVHLERELNMYIPGHPNFFLLEVSSL